jgi:hypothetical protein
MPASKELFQKYMNPVFIETGTFQGKGVQQALDAGFSKIYSIELSIELYNECVQGFNNDKVFLLLGDSAEVLPTLIKEINEPITFWLDGHYSGTGTALGSQNTPLLQELESIRLHPIKTHTILIDDLRGWYKDTQGFDTLDLMKIILTINPDYVFTLENGYVPNDILVAKCL